MTTHLLFLAGFLLLPFIGLATWRIEAVRRMDLAARIAIAGAAGAMITAVVMAMLSLLHIEWSRTALVLILGTIAAVSWRRATANRQRPTAHWSLVFILLTCYGLLTARETAGDLHFFWGPKAIGFFRAGGIDPTFLANKINPNADYPPLVPLLYAWSHTLAHQFSWWGALLTTALFLFGTIAIVRGCSGDADGALLVAATLAFTFAIGFAAGGADPPLVFFEALTLAALTFIDDERGRDILAALGLAGAAWTKIEGATFVVAIVIAVLVMHRSVKRALIIAAPALILLAGWLAFLVFNGLVFGYGGAKMGIHLAVLPKTLLLTAKAGLYELYGLPWLVPIALLAMGRARRAALPLIVAVLTIGAAIFFYIHVPDPAWWIAASAPRVLLTPLTALLIAAIAANREVAAA